MPWLPEEANAKNSVLENFPQANYYMLILFGTVQRLDVRLPRVLPEFIRIQPRVQANVTRSGGEWMRWGNGFWSSKNEPEMLFYGNKLETYFLESTKILLSFGLRKEKNFRNYEPFKYAVTSQSLQENFFISRTRILIWKLSGFILWIKTNFIWKIFPSVISKSLVNQDQS